MMTRIHGVIHFECDGCAASIDTEQREFSDALRDAKADGWKPRQVNGVWMHYCGDCGGPGDRRPDRLGDRDDDGDED